MTTIIQALGTGTCHGLDDRTSPLFTVSWGEHPEQRVFFELSADFRRRVMTKCQVDPACLDKVHIAVSHVHEDHFSGAMSFKVARHCARQALNVSGAGEVKIYGPHQLTSAMEHLEKGHLPEREHQKLEHAGMKFVHPEDGERVQIADAKLEMYHVFHADPTVEAVGFRLILPDETIVAYTGDVAWPHDPRSHSMKIAEQMQDVGQNASVLICDAGGRVGQTSERHLSPFEAGQLAKDCRVASLALTHYTGLDSEESMLADVRRSGYEEECWILTDGFSMGVE